MTQPSEQPRTRPVAPHGLPSPDGRFLWDAERAAWVPKSTWREATAPDPVASPPEAVRLLRKVIRELPDGSETRELHKHQRDVLAEARRYLAATEEGTP